MPFLTSCSPLPGKRRTRIKVYCLSLWRDLWGSWLDLGNKNIVMGKSQLWTKARLIIRSPMIVMFIALLTVASTIAFMALFDWIAE